MLQSKEIAPEPENVEEHPYEQSSEQVITQQIGKDIRLNISEPDAKEVTDNG